MPDLHHTYSYGATGGYVLPAMGIPASYLSCVMGWGWAGDITFSSSIRSVAHLLLGDLRSSKEARFLMCMVYYSEWNGIFMITETKGQDFSSSTRSIYKFLAPGWTVVQWLGLDVLLTNAWF